MARKDEDLRRIEEGGVVAVVRLREAGSLLKVADALREGGIAAIEFTMTTPGALKVLEEASAAFKGDVIFGAGTVLDPETARAAILAGAQFVVAPNLNPKVIELCNRYSVASMPGCLTPTEIVQAWECGADVVKVFPANQFGPEYISAVLAPLPHIKLAPVGGVDLSNVTEYIKAGAACVGVGSSLVNSKLIASGDWVALTARAKGFIEGVQKGRA